MKRKLLLMVWAICLFWTLGNEFVIANGPDTIDTYTITAQEAAESAPAKNASSAQTVTIDEGTKETSTSFGGWPTDLSSPNFTFDTNNLSPTTNKYTGGTKANLTKIIGNIGKYLLIATTTLAVLSITIGGIMIATTGPSDRAAKGKTIISLNIMAIVIALLSYSIIQFVRWLLSA